MRTSRVVTGKQSKLSVIVPSWNYGCFLDDCLRSLLACTEHEPGVRPFSQIVVIDDCSTDNTGTIAKEYARAGVDYVRNPERIGIVQILNHYLPQLPTEWVCKVDADDVVAPDFARAHLEVIDRDGDDPKLGLVYCGATYRVTHTPTERPHLDGLTIGIRDWDPVALQQANYVTGSAVIRRSALLDVGGFPDVALQEDHQGWLRFAAKGYRGACVKRSLLGIRLHHLGSRDTGTDWRREGLRA